jgi:chromosomal replication initiator protein
MTTCGLDKDVWTQFIEFVQSRCSATEFENWISPIRCIEVKDTALVLEVPNVFVQEYLLENYKNALCHFLPCRPNGEPAITFTVAGPCEPKKRKITVQSEARSNSKLNPTYTFDTFIEGPSNQFVKSSAMGVAARPGKTYNPLFIYGGVGLGKTHLLHGVGHYVEQRHKKCRTECITTEEFINNLVDHLRNKSIDKMKRFFRNLDVLLVDDIQFLESRLNFEEEFCNTFESLIKQNKQIVITSDKPPSQLKLSERLIARMEWGLVAHVAPPDLETRVAILCQKSEAKGLCLDTQVAFFIAEHIHANVRQLEGAINKLSAYAHLMGMTLNKEAVCEILQDIFQTKVSKSISVDEILDIVSTLYDVKKMTSKATLVRKK